MPNPREALTKEEQTKKNAPGSHPWRRGRPAPKHSPYATLHAYHPGGGQVNAEQVNAESRTNRRTKVKCCSSRPEPSKAVSVRDGFLGQT